MLIMLQDVEPVGRYALRFKWSDGHDTGLFTFEALRKMCQCDICEPEKEPAEEKKTRTRRLL